MVASSSLRARCTTVLASCWDNSANTLRAKATASPWAKLVGTARTAKVLADRADTSMPSASSASAQASAVATSWAVAVKVAGINSGWLAMACTSICCLSCS